MSTTVRMTDHKQWAALNLDTVLDAHEMEYVNQEDDGCDSLAGEWYVADDERRVIISGTFGNDHSPGASHYTSAELYDNEDEYRAALAKWEAAPEYLPSHACCPKCGNACVEYDDDAHGEYERYTAGCDDEVCEDCATVYDSSEMSYQAD